MNKLMGFYELKYLNLPSIPWQEFNENVVLDPQFLWTIRTAINQGNDLSLPRLVGVTANEAYIKGKEIYETFKNKGMVIYYPYFIAEKSGTLDISNDRIVIEAVEKDLWNLVTDSKKNVTIMEYGNGDVFYDGDEKFLSSSEVNQLKSYLRELRHIFKDDLFENKSVLLEWSYAFNTDINKQPIGDRYLVFYEIRTV